MNQELTQEKIPFTAKKDILQKLAFNDNVYAWLLLHSYNDNTEDHCYIYKDNFTFKQIAKDIRRNAHTVSKRFEQLLEEDIIQEKDYYGKTAYIMTPYKPYQYLHAETILGLLNLPLKDNKEETIKVLVFLLQKREENERAHRKSFKITAKEILRTFNHNETNPRGYERIKAILTILQGAGIIKFKVIKNTNDESLSETYVYYVAKSGKAKDEWLGIKESQNKVVEEIVFSERLEKLIKSFTFSGGRNSIMQLKEKGYNDRLIAFCIEERGVTEINKYAEENEKSGLGFLFKNNCQFLEIAKQDYLDIIKQQAHCRFFDAFVNQTTSCRSFEEYWKKHKDSYLN